jgi:integrase
MHKLFQDALMDDKVVYNPVSKIPLVDEKPTRSSGTLEPSDQAEYVAAMYRRGAQYGMLADLMLWTGARIMAAAAIQYQDVDFEIGLIRIRRLVERATGNVVTRTKGAGEDGAEIVPLFPALRDRILAHRKAGNYVRPTDFIAAAPDGSYVAYESFRDAHAEALTELKIPRFTPHAIRKAFATNSKRAGYTRAEIREMLGHSTEAMTARYDLEDIEHLIEKGKRLGFGKSVSTLSAKRRGAPRILKGGRK